MGFCVPHLVRYCCDLRTEREGGHPMSLVLGSKVVPLFCGLNNGIFNSKARRGCEWPSLQKCHSTLERWGDMTKISTSYRQGGTRTLQTICQMSFLFHKLLLEAGGTECAAGKCWGLQNCPILALSCERGSALSTIQNSPLFLYQAPWQRVSAMPLCIWLFPEKDLQGAGIPCTRTHGGGKEKIKGRISVVVGVWEPWLLRTFHQ